MRCSPVAGVVEIGGGVGVGEPHAGRRVQEQDVRRSVPPELVEEERRAVRPDAERAELLLRAVRHRRASWPAVQPQYQRRRLGLRRHFLEPIEQCSASVLVDGDVPRVHREVHGRLAGQPADAVCLMPGVSGRHRWPEQACPCHKHRHEDWG